METVKLAVPSTNPGGMNADMSMHFGHCDIYTIVEVEGEAVRNVTTLENIPHEQGGCMASVQHLMGNGVNALLSGGMGMRPLAGFRQAGIEVFFAGNCPTVEKAVQGYLSKSLQPFSSDFTCKGH